MSIVNIIDDAFFNEEPDPITDYVSCIDLHRIPRTIPVWRVHEDRYVEYASLLALCVHFSGLSRHACSRLLASKVRVSHRRLEEYARWTGITDIVDAVWKGYGKLVAYTVYMYYPSHVTDRWTRHLEIRMYVSIPLHIEPRQGLTLIGYDVLIETAKMILEELGFARMMLEMADWDIGTDVKEGIEEIRYPKDVPDRYAPFAFNVRYTPIAKWWCNFARRASFDAAYFVVEDYRRHYTWMPEKYEWSPEDVRDLLSLIYLRIVNRLRYW